MAGQFQDDQTVAVIAVHGVADQKPYETAQTAANMLLHLDELEDEDGIDGFRKGRYPGFEQESMRIATAGIDLSECDGSRDEWEKEIHKQLKDFELESSAENYDTIRLEGSRLDEDPETGETRSKGIHVYEMYWADLSKLGRGVFSILVALYRLLFELAWVGTRALKRDKSLHDADESAVGMRFLRWLHRSATVSISCVVPLLNIFLFGLIIVTIVAGLAWFEGDRVPYGTLYRLLFSVSIGLLVLSVYAFWLRGNVWVTHNGDRIRARRWLKGPWEWRLGMAMFLAIGSGWLVNDWLSPNSVLFSKLGLQLEDSDRWTEALLGISVWIFVVALFFGTVVKLIKQRQGPGRTYWVSGIAVCFLTVMLIIGMTVPTYFPRMVSGGGFALAMGVALLGAVWMVVLVQAGLFVFLGQPRLWYFRYQALKLDKQAAKLMKGQQDAEANVASTDARAMRQRARTLETAILAVTLPTMLTMLLNVGLWWAAILPLKQTDLFDDVVRNAIERREDADHEVMQETLMETMAQAERELNRKLPSGESLKLGMEKPGSHDEFIQALDKVVGEASQAKAELTPSTWGAFMEAVTVYKERNRTSKLVPPDHWALNFEKEVISISQTTGFLALLERMGVDISKQAFFISDRPKTWVENHSKAPILNTTVLGRYDGKIYLQVFDTLGVKVEMEGADLWPYPDEVLEISEYARKNWDFRELRKGDELRNELEPLVSRILERRDIQFSRLVDDALQNTVQPYVNLAFLAVILVSVFSCWVFLPALLSEGTPHSSLKQKENEEDKEAARHEVISEVLGKSLQKAFGSLAFAQVVLVLCIVGILAGTLARQYKMTSLAVEEYRMDLQMQSEGGYDPEDHVGHHIDGWDIFLLGIDRNEVMPRPILEKGADKRRLPRFQWALGNSPILAESNREKTVGKDYKLATDSSLVLQGLASTAYFAIAVLILFVNTPIGGFARPLFDSFRSGMDVALDVVNYMRLRPENHNVRAQILCRYASLLRYIGSYRDPKTGKGYSRIVILAHSQGTVITADLLRLVKNRNVAVGNNLDYLTSSEPDGGLSCPIRVFTMGSPLRQIYAERFPATYGWASPELNGSGIQTKDFLGVELWWNAYRSGDYVGRYLWRHDESGRFIPYAHNPVASNHTPNGGTNFPELREYCLSPGAHTQYWNETAPEVMRDFDRLIAIEGVPQRKNV